MVSLEVFIFFVFVGGYYRVRRSFIRKCLENLNIWKGVLLRFFLSALGIGVLGGLVYFLI